HHSHHRHPFPTRRPSDLPPPAPATAPVAASVPRPSMVATEQYYDIDGSSAGALRDQINRLGPKDESGKSRDALTVWSIEWSYAADRKSTRLNSSHQIISY